MPRGELGRRLEQVGNDDDQACAASAFPPPHGAIARCCPRLRASMFSISRRTGLSVSVLATGSKRRVTRSVKNESGRRVALADEQVHQPGRERARVFELGDRAGLAKMEAGRGVDQHAGPQVGLVLEAPDHVAVGLREDRPVDQVGRVALDVIAVLGEFHRAPKSGERCSPWMPPCIGRRAAMPRPRT